MCSLVLHPPVRLCVVLFFIFLSDCVQSCSSSSCQIVLVEGGRILRKQHQGKAGSCADTKCSLKRQWLWHVYRAGLVFYFGVVVTHISTNIPKYTIGRCGTSVRFNSPACVCVCVCASVYVCVCMQCTHTRARVCVCMCACSV